MKRSFVLLARIGVLFTGTFVSAAPVPATRPTHVVMAYVPAWRDTVADPATFDYTAFTHICRAFLRPRGDGTLYEEPGFFSPKLEAAARAHGVKLLMSIGGESSDPTRWLSIARSPEHLKTFLDGIADRYRHHPYDGVDIDWEPPPKTVADGQLYLGLLKAIRARFPGKLLTVALSPKEYAVHSLPLADVVATIDFYNAMTYDYSGPWTGVATFSANFHSDKAGANTSSSVEDGLRNLIEVHHVPPAKIVMGLTFWGYRFRVDKIGDRFPKNAPHMADNVDLAQIQDLLGTGLYTAHRDELADAAYLTRSGGGSVITYDDEQSIQDKCRAALAAGCAGVMMWHGGADEDAGRYPLLDSIMRAFGGHAAALSRPALEQEIARLGRKQPPADCTPEQLLRLDAGLRKRRGFDDDRRWMATAASHPATQPAAAPAHP